MGTVPFTLWNQQLVEASTLNLQPGQQVVALESAEINNETGTIYNSVKLQIEYTNLTPSIGQFFIGCDVVYQDSNGLWVPLAYQYSPVRSSSQASTRILILQPNIDSYNQGIDDIVFPVDTEIARISRQQGILPETKFKVRILIKDNDPLGPNAFQSVTVTGSGERYIV